MFIVVFIFPNPSYSFVPPPFESLFSFQLRPQERRISLPLPLHSSLISISPETMNAPTDVQQQQPQLPQPQQQRPSSNIAGAYFYEQPPTAAHHDEQHLNGDPSSTAHQPPSSASFPPPPYDNQPQPQHPDALPSSQDHDGGDDSGMSSPKRTAHSRVLRH